MTAADMLFSTEDEATTRAVSGTYDEIRRKGGSVPQAEAVEVALKRFLMGDVAEARKALRHGFAESEIDQIIFQFELGVMDGQKAA